MQRHRFSSLPGWLTPASMVSLCAFAPAQNSGLDWLRFLGGPRADVAGFPNGLHVDAQGDIWVGGADRINAPAAATVHRLSGTGTLAMSVALGSSGLSRSNAIVTDASGQLVYVAGRTTDPALPVTANAVQPMLRGSRDMFFAVFDAATLGILYLTYLGGDGDDLAVDLEVTPQGRAWLYGISSSSNFPTTPNAFQPINAGGYDAVLACIDPGTAGPAGLVYGICFGSSGNEPGGNLSDLHLDQNGVLTFFGDTDGPGFSALTTPGAFQRTFGGVVDAFVARLDPQQAPSSQLLYCSLFGGNGRDVGNAMEVSGNLVTLGGWTDSTTLPTSQPGLPPAVQPAPGGALDAFCAQLDLGAVGTAALRYCSYLGGSGDDGANDLVLDDAGNIVLTGATGSAGLSTPGSFQGGITPGGSGFLARIDPVVGRLLYCSYLGDASGSTVGMLLRAAEGGAMVMAGHTSASGLPVTMGSTSSGAQDQFVARWNLQPDGAARCLSGSGAPFRGSLDATSWPATGNTGFSLLAGGAPQNNCATTFGLLVGSPAPCAPLPVPPFGTLLLARPVPLQFLLAASGRAELSISLAGVPVGASAAFQCVWFEPCPSLVSATSALEITVR